VIKEWYVAVRDSKSPAAHLVFGADDWQTFVAEIKTGRLG
jgi:hypothetical protein